MARFLLGWELGANRGHLVRLAEMARGLVERGHEVAVASQRLDLSFDWPAGVTLWQAPLWPRLLANVGAVGGDLPNTMGDILYRVALENPDALPALIAGWQALMAAVKPDAVAADFAPALLCAVRGSVPVVAVGLGFDTIPPQLEQFPSLTGKPPVYAEAPLLEQVNKGLAQMGVPTLDRLPAIFGADRVLAGTFTELDPYAPWRQEPVVAPSVSHPLGETAEGEEIFLYADATLLRAGPLWDGLVRSGLPVRVYAPSSTPAQRAEMVRLGFKVEVQPVPFERIAARSRLAMTSGGLGFVSSALASGLPVVVMHHDLEKGLTGQAVTRMQLGGHVHTGSIQADAFATSLRQLYQNDSFQRRARELAPGFRARLAPTQEALAVEALLDLVGAR
ncbi:glycosyl transferase-like UDP-glucuronosyltransferase [Sphingomonas sp. ID1715]|uniref:glycosyltransferase n=1 Tax=Sphingomonas sp. ID1715 TaxID=1656898 RepID=UPI0014882D2C|nr:glycosyl transferase-like UDP-glucuronosyltransferase [Sphingomonas sp. ID1715]NNM78134.1 glycosyl transferase-like UDP-glucuronosyltransferase [Sphingomonas sp. ID1715]